MNPQLRVLPLHYQSILACPLGFEPSLTGLESVLFPEHRHVFYICFRDDKREDLGSFSKWYFIPLYYSILCGRRTNDYNTFIPFPHS